jgi:UDP-N-acetylmuramoylalanine--D-glutamate ligase
MRLYDGQSVLLVGLGESGLACARWIIQQGGSLTIVDTRDNPPGLSALAGQNYSFAQSLDTTDRLFRHIVVSPGLAPSHPLMVAVQVLAGELKITVDSELDLFADALQALAEQRAYKPKVIGITGTNGKTTTTSMVACLAHQAGLSVKAAGNISPAALDALREAIDINILPQIWVLELSSFQLHWTKRLHCDASVVLNLTQDHLDWHASEQEYASDKQRIFSPNSSCVLNRDDAVVAAMKLPEGVSRWTFGLGRPTTHQEMGLVRDGGIQWLAYAIAPADEGTPRRRKDSAPDAQVKLLMPMDALKVVGLHNAANAMAALALGYSVGLPIGKMLHGLRAYAGEPHRVEHVLNLDGVDYYDDSKGTNVGATAAALNGLQRPCVLIAGGQGKGQDFTPLNGPVREYCKALVLFGQDASLIAQALKSEKPIHQVTNMKEAVLKAHSIATAGDCVLLSPACASLDMYKNYVARAEDFIQEVKELANERGQVC